MATYEWKIANLESNVADGGVVIAHWRCTATEGENSVSAYGTAGFTPDASAGDFVAYADLTEETVLGWVNETVSKEDTETSLAAKLDELANPVTTAGTPWES